MKTVNLKEIMIETLKYRIAEIDESLMPLLLEFGKEACNQAIDLCAFNADADYNYAGTSTEFDDEDIDVFVLEKSITDTKEQIKP